MAEFNKPDDLSIVWGSTGAVARPDTAKINEGWVVEIPLLEHFNWYQNRVDGFVAHLNQHGLPLHDVVTEYQANRSYVIGSNGEVYRCIQTHTNKNPVTAPDTALFWVRAFDAYDTSYTKSESDAAYLAKASNLSDLPNTATARTNLSVYSKAEVDSMLGVSGMVVKSVFASFSTATTISSSTPNDATIPQITEGQQILSTSITPTSAANKIRVTAVIPYAVQGAHGAGGIFHLHKGVDTNAFVAARTITLLANETPALRTNMTIIDEFVAGTTSPLTIQIRAGTYDDDFYVNDSNLGGSVKTTLLVEEIVV